MRIAALVLCVCAGLMTSAAPAQNGVPAKLEDAGTTARVKGVLITNKSTKAHQINVETQGGVVQLSGFVDSEVARQAAVAAARNVDGVKEVQDRLLIRDAGRTTGQATADTVIAAKLKTELAGSAGLGVASDVIVEVNSGVVELSGFVPTFDEKNRAAEIARRISGVMDVKNNITVKTRG
jgi:hyperosmotically inducible periplasmic protein